MLVAAAGGVAAAGQEVEELAVLLTGGGGLPPALPLMLATSLLAMAVEAAVTASLRVHDLRAAGIEPDAHMVSRDVIIAMTGAAPTPTYGGATVVNRPARQEDRGPHRWSQALVPFVGIAYSSWDAERTIDARLPPLPLFRVYEINPHPVPEPSAPRQPKAQRGRGSRAGVASVGDSPRAQRAVPTSACAAGPHAERAEERRDH